tara:strand:- start:774 stop:1853 length:1080 start_codon:yes stop_codon:yes gene_type:complete
MKNKEIDFSNDYINIIFLVDEFNIELFGDNLSINKNFLEALLFSLDKYIKINIFLVNNTKFQVEDKRLKNCFCASLENYNKKLKKVNVFFISEINNLNQFTTQDQFIKKMTSLKIFPTITLVSSFYNEQNNINDFWAQIKKLSQIMNIVEIIFVDNASNDDTFMILKDIQKYDNRIKILKNNPPSNYSKGFSKAIKKSNGNYTMILHSDCEFYLFNTFSFWLESISKKKDLSLSIDNTVFSYRLNRSIFSNLFTYINNWLAKRFIFQDKKIDFFSTPKIILTELIKDYKTYSGINGFLFDISLLNHLKNKNKFYFKKKFLPFIPVIIYPRKQGKSSWNSNFINYILEIYDHLFFYLRNL